MVKPVARIPALPPRLAELAAATEAALAAKAEAGASPHWRPGTTCIHCTAQAVSRCDCCCGLFCADHGYAEICCNCRRS